jgi:thiol:disulfide interchange protein
MKTRFSLLLLGLSLLLPAVLRAEPEYPKMGPDIYDVSAKGSDQVEAAIWKATAEHKRILLDLGANWCIWCRRLHATFENDPAVAKVLADNYVVVMVDVNTRRGTARNADVVSRYHNPIEHGVPVIVLLDASGKYLVTKDTGDFEEGQAHSPAKIVSFLTAWAPPKH